MNIDELKKKYPGVVFCEARGPLEDMSIDTIEDFFKTVENPGSVVIYRQTEVSAEEAENSFFVSAIDKYMDYHGLYDADADDFGEYIVENLPDEIMKCFAIPAHTSIELMNPANKLVYRHISGTVPSDVVEKIFDAFDELYDCFEAEKDADKKELEKKKIEIIENFRNDYSKAITKNDKKAVIQKVQNELKHKLDINAADDPTVTKTSLAIYYNDDRADND